MKACRAGRIDLVKRLCDQGANLEMRDTEGSTAMVWAVYGRAIVAIDELYKRGADVNTRLNDGRTPLMCAAVLNHMGRTIVQHLCDLGADVNAQSLTGATALSQAVLCAHISIAIELCSRGARVSFGCFEVASRYQGTIPLLTKQQSRHNVLVLVDEVLTRDLLRLVHRFM